MNAQLLAGIALAATLAAAVGLPSPGVTEPAGDARRATEGSENPFCPLTDTQQQQASKAFSAMTPTFRHPRCANCHGGVDPFSQSGGHLGGEMPVFTTMDEGTGFETEDQERTLAQCQECHGALPGWKQPAPQLAFVNKSDTELCVQMKRMIFPANEFLRHIEHDVGSVNFIAEAFRGTRGLNEMGRDIFAAEAERPFRPEPPPISHAAFLAQARAWVDAMDGEYPEDYLCGCVPLRFELRFDSEVTFASEGVSIKERVQTTIPLTAKAEAGTSSNPLRGAALLQSEVVGMEVPGCVAKVTSTGDTARVLEVKADPKDWLSTLSVTLWPGKTEILMHLTCPKGSGSAPPSPGMWAPTWLHLHQDEHTNGIAVIRNWEPGDYSCSDAGDRCSVARKTYQRSSTCMEGGSCTEKTKIEIWLLTGADGSGPARRSQRRDFESDRHTSVALLTADAGPRKPDPAADQGEPVPLRHRLARSGPAPSGHSTFR
ncbi:MAG: hypothetical protein ACREMZ_15585 [Gemmatimonadales bacterium]